VRRSELGKNTSILSIAFGHFNWEFGGGHEGVDPAHSESSTRFLEDLGLLLLEAFTKLLLDGRLAIW